MTRSVDDLAADVRACLTVRPLLSETRMEAEAALSELVALAERASRLACDRDICLQRAEAAEAALADMRRAQERVDGMVDEIDCAIEAYVTTGLSARDALDLIGEEIEKYRALAAAGPAPEEAT